MQGKRRPHVAFIATVLVFKKSSGSERYLISGAVDRVSGDHVKVDKSWSLLVKPAELADLS